MKKFLSVILSVVMLLSCLAVFVVNTNAQVEYPNGRLYTVAYKNGTDFAYHRISDSFYVSQNCYQITGRIKYLVDDQGLIEKMHYVCAWYVYYSNATTPQWGSEAGSAASTFGSYYTYYNQLKSLDPQKTVTSIQIVHRLCEGTVTVSELRSVYS